MIAVQASFGGISFWAESLDGNRARRVVEHNAFARNGADTEDTGRNAWRDTIKARMIPKEYTAFLKLVNEAKIRTFTHPLLGSYRARASIESHNIPAGKGSIVEFTIIFVEDTSQPLATKNAAENTRTLKQKIAAINADIAEAIESEEFEDDTDLQFYTDEWSNDYDDFVNIIDSYEAGEKDSADVQRMLNMIQNSTAKVINEVHLLNDYRDGAHNLVNDLYCLIDTAQALVLRVLEQSQAHFVATIQSPIDVYYLCLQTYGNMENATEIMERNRLLDPFCIPAGLQIEMPIP